MKLFTVTAGNSPMDCHTFETDDIEETMVNKPYVNITLNFAVTREALTKALEDQD